ncbi:MAG: thioredoxin domain-containing protein [Candidatus Micrarchaeota archaeon]
MSEKGADTVTLSKDLFYGILIIGMAVLVVISVMTQGFGIIKCQQTVCAPCNNNTGGTTGGQTGNASGNTSGDNAVTVMQIPSLLSSSPIMGSTSGAVTVVEFSDYQCPFCGMAYGSPWADAYASQYGPIIGVVKKVETEYVKTGKASFRHYPVAFLGQESIDASNAAMCANAQDKYWEMHDALFVAQTPEENDGKYSKANLKLLAQNISGLDQAAFGACVDGDTYVSTVDDMTADWQAVSGANTGRAGTPTFYILVDASKVSKEKVSAAASGSSYTWGLSSDSKTYLIVASPEYAKLKLALDALAN